MAAWQHRSHPALLLAHPAGWHPGFWAGKCDWEEEDIREASTDDGGDAGGPRGQGEGTTTTA